RTVPGALVIRLIAASVVVAAASGQYERQREHQSEDRHPSLLLCEQHVDFNPLLLIWNRTRIIRCQHHADVPPTTPFIKCQLLPVLCRLREDYRPPRCSSDKLKSFSEFSTVSRIFAVTAACNPSKRSHIGMPAGLD